MEPAPTPDRSRREGLAIAVVTLIGAGLRIWPPGRFGLTHFDEGIYALAGSWSPGPGGIPAIDPSLIPYAPPGFPILVGLAYRLLGPSDVAAIAVSQVVGTMTVPVVARLARRSFGPGAGFASAVYCAFSGPHIAFSRMALTDASFLLAWLLAIGAGMRFLERPGVIRAVLLGLAVGLAQQFKYNGWLAGGIVIVGAVVGLLARPEVRRASSIRKVFGWGAAAAVVAAQVVWPWYRFVEAHGGYSALLRHQQGYVGGVRDWWPHLRIQADQAVAMSGGRVLIGSTLAVAGLSMAIARPESWRALMASDRDPVRRGILTVASVLMPFLFLEAPYWLGLLMVPWLLTGPRPAARLVGVWWLVLAAISPFYHPYARLWLPLHAANWLMMAWLVPNFFAASRTWRERSGTTPRDRTRHRVERVYLLVMIAAGLLLKVATEERAWIQPDLLTPSDSLRRATSRVVPALPEDVAGLRLLVRPPVTFYLAGRVALFPMSGSDQLRVPGNPRLWALVDSAILRSESGRPSEANAANLLARFSNHWEIVEEFPTTLSLPTMLDLDPASALVESADRSAPLWLLRPRRPGPSR
jgi:dolichyl-phosphate-mannose-protein mannosyltransferase